MKVSIGYSQNVTESDRYLKGAEYNDQDCDKDRNQIKGSALHSEKFRQK